MQSSISFRQNKALKLQIMHSIFKEAHAFSSLITFSILNFIAQRKEWHTSRVQIKYLNQNHPFAQTMQSDSSEWKIFQNMELWKA